MPVVTQEQKIRVLPYALEPWRELLSLFSPDLIEPMGELLLRLAPHVGKLRFASQRVQKEHAGIGNIVRRGEFERLLTTEWAFADAEPDEFIRRVANNELLFLGPEPAISLNSHLCIALFDCGPMQLGEPRLAQVALFILLARRAMDVGADFRWGILQQPAELHKTTDARSIKKLLDSKFLDFPSNQELEQWSEELSKNDSGLFDCWQISANLTPRIKQINSLVTVERNIFGDHDSVCLNVCMQHGQYRSEIKLNLPPEDIAIRILRNPFSVPRPNDRILYCSGKLSLQKKPILDGKGHWLAVAQLDNKLAVYNVPQTVKVKPGKSRKLLFPEQGEPIAVGLFGKHVHYITLRSGELNFHGFQDRLFANASLPDADLFKISPGGKQWLSMYYVRRTNAVENIGRVYVVDMKKNLVCWEFSTDKRQSHKEKESRTRLVFKAIAKNVIGVLQFGEYLIYAVANVRTTDFYRESFQSSELIGSFPVRGIRVLFGDDSLAWFHMSKFGPFAIQTEAGKKSDRWRIVANGDDYEKELPSSTEVLGMWMLPNDKQASPGLVTAASCRKKILFFEKVKVLELLTSQEHIGPVSMSSGGGRIAWIESRTRDAKVYELKERGLLLKVMNNEVVQ